MKAAIYSRIMEEEQRPDLQLFFDELAKQKIEPIIFLNFYEQIKDSILLPATTKTFAISEDLSDEIECLISLGGDGTLLDTITIVKDKHISIMGINSDFENMAKSIQTYAHTQLQDDGIDNLVLQLETICLQACEELKEELYTIKNTHA